MEKPIKSQLPISILSAEPSGHQLIVSLLSPCQSGAIPPPLPFLLKMPAFEPSFWVQGGDLHVVGWRVRGGGGLFVDSTP